MLLVGGLALAGFTALRPKAPTWELVNIKLEAISIPGLSNRGIAPADTSNCPDYDKCGLLLARGCSECPAGFPNNQGCLCSSEPDDSGSDSSGPAPGTVVLADTSNCPILDKCGIIFPDSRGCSVCPDDTWINDGCTCRQPTSGSSSFSGIGDLFNLLTGGGVSDGEGSNEASYPVEITLGVDVKVHNPNILGAKTEEGRVGIYWKDMQFAETVVPPTSVNAHSTLVIPTQVIVDQLSISIGLQLLAEILKTGGLLTVDALGSVTAEGPFGLLVDTLVSCKVTADVFHNSEIVDSNCNYDYDL